MMDAQPAQATRPSISGLPWIGPLTAAVAAAANAVLALVLGRLLDVPSTFTPLSIGSVVFLTVAGALAATVVVALVARRAADPVRTFRRIAVVALVASWVPDIALLVGPSPAFPVSPAGVGVLMILHATAALIIVTLLTTLATRPRG